jgi:molybdopterin molybdotransferase
MAQLSDDCFAFSGPLLPVAEAERLIAERVAPVSGRETVTLRQAAGRVLAENIVAPVDVPPFDNSAVDGYAVRADDLDGERESRLNIVDRVAAGQAASRALKAGEAIRIFTGAPMPAGADTVFMQEDCRLEGGEGGAVVVPAGLKRGANRRLAGEDIRAGAVALPAGRRLAVQHVALAAALGLTELGVNRRVRVALFSTGDEIVEPGTLRSRAALYDSNRYLLAGLIGRFGAEVTDLGILSDDAKELARAIAAAAADHDLVLTSGGVSTGEADHVRSAIENIGRIVFWRVAIKPGRPVAMGVIPGPHPNPPPRAGERTLKNPPPQSGERTLKNPPPLAGEGRVGADGAAFVGLPGNPVAVFVTFVRVVRPLLLRLAGALPEPLIAMPARAAFSYRKRKGRREYVRVALRKAPDGAIEAVKHAQDGAGVLTSLTETDGLAELSEDVTKVEPGSTVGFLSYASLLG